VMGQIGHADPTFTLRVYAHMMRRGEDEKARLRALVEGQHWASAGTSGVPGIDTPEDDAGRDAESPAIAGLSAVEPDGIEPTTSCLQSTRSQHAAAR
jgi:hypothetical protein